MTREVASIMLKKIGLGIIVWAIPYVTALPLMSLMRSDPTVFKTTIAVGYVLSHREAQHV